MLLLTTAATAPPVPPPLPPKLRFVTGGESGTYYAFGSVIAQHATNNAGINVVGLVGNGLSGQRAGAGGRHR